MALIGIYKGNVTAGGQDGTAVSSGGSYSAPVAFSLNASENEVQIQTLAIRCNAGYRTSGNTTISDLGDATDRMKLSLDQTTWSDSITISESIGAANVLFYVKASSSSNELPQLDRSIKLRVSTQIAAA